MQTITATQARQEFAQLMDAARLQPVMIQRQNRDVAVVMSVEEYQRLAHLNVERFQQFCEQIGARAEAAGLNETRLQALLRD
ncbi:type II toxin-antitoxin system Phd/YefM family antitoxin [Comamonas sp. NLF-1-9]|uniref:type II toxin-antitoxin system Phd/YefM family antitoxin n=1 Tax=Comamonas sp. NLF-1-9 TaxID=2853163 RepID=UPI001C49165A|nr:type II toxin-antitoxin system Phd/YefM family antitoxin [Comamonas sp. NLF-1-9]QXL85473.1 type II toxin-antitoxin system Phd/YefM family antitoxin [Comamonas sp. NLF-1-9]